MERHRFDAVIVYVRRIAMARTVNRAFYIKDRQELFEQVYTQNLVDYKGNHKSLFFSVQQNIRKDMQKQNSQKCNVQTDRQNLLRFHSNTFQAL